MSIPPIYSDSRYMEHLRGRNRLFAHRAREAFSMFSDVPGIQVIQPKGAFYMTILFNEGVLNDRQSLPIREESVRRYVDEITRDVPPDKRFIYYLLAARGICAVPLTGFCSDLQGFRITLLETDDDIRRATWENLVDGIGAYISV
jgi:aspartate/methionine/tyrosine aminotransferase